ncbi:zinc ribbon domain-containing protein [Flavobacterium cheniae]|nr:hypothetical protein [Flavobacterium cheniae]
MRFLKKKRNKNYKWNILIMSIAFIAIVAFANHIYKYTHNYINGSYTVLKNSRKVISDNDIYNFMNEIYSNESIENVTKDSLKFRKLMCFSIPHGDSFINLIDELPDTIVNVENKEYLINQLDKKTKLWDKTKLKGFWVLTPSDLKKVDQLEKSNGKDYWTNYKTLYGKGNSSCSIPIFDKNKSVAIIHVERSADYLLANSSIYVYLKRNGRWEYYTQSLLWIS